MIRTEVKASGRTAVISIIMLVAAVVIAAVLAYLIPSGAKKSHSSRASVIAPTPRRPTSPLPEVLPPPPPPPMALVQMPTDAALASNAAVPFSTDPIVGALPFHYVGTPDDHAKALTCLTAAVLYEAGDDAPGEQAVAQVVLNRLRHPAFPKTVCGVIFQGSERPTGCQFTFTCDGALDRPPQPVAWQRAKMIATAALSGAVDKTVGTATHYHTNWVVPYWRDSLVKLAQVHTQIFYRWSGWWGTRPAFTGTLQPAEPLDPAIAARVRGEPPPGAAEQPAPAPQVPGALEEDKHGEGLAVLGVTPKALGGNLVRAMDRARAEFVLELDPSAYPGSYAIISLALCGTADACRVMGWMPNTGTPTALPVGAAKMRSVAFVYERQAGSEKAMWDCKRIRRETPAQCLPETPLSPFGPVRAVK